MKLFVRNSILDLSYPHVMGILNITPDSFYDGGMHNLFVNAIQHASSMINAGATIIDVGGESTRPGATEVSVEEELSRVIPIIKAITKRFKEIWISVDTSKPEVIKESAKAGAHIINDVFSLTKPGALKAALEVDLPLCLVHMKGKPKTMQNAPVYGNVFNDVSQFFAERIKYCVHSGISKKKILLDPGFGFGKDLTHNYTLLSHLSEFHRFKLPLLIGVSRKSMISELLGVSPNKSLNGSLACAVIAAMQGAHIIRVHDVKETKEVIRIVRAVLSTRKNKYYE